MSNATVFLLILDSFKGFDSALNKTIQNLLQAQNLSQYNTANIRKCDPLSVETILQVIDKTNYSEDLTLTNSNESNANSLLENNFIEKEIGNKNITIYDTDNEYDKNNIEEGDLVSLGDEKNFPRLVAIFESLSNVTAQTCAGTLVSPEWVLTAAACVDVLPQLYGYDSDTLHHTRSNYTSRYTIVANATNPLVDGTVHDVIEIILQGPSHDDDKGKVLQHLVVEEPSVALMRINAGIRVRPVRVMEKVVIGGAVTVLGWSLLKNLTGHDTMAAAYFSAEVTDSNKCVTDNRIFENDIICLSASNRTYKQLNQINFGGPVIVYTERNIHLVAVVHTIQNFLVTAYPISKHTVARIHNRD